MGGQADIKKIGKKNFAAIYIAATTEEKAAGKHGKVVKLSNLEAVVLRTFLNTKDYELTAKEAEIKTESVKRILRRPELKAALEDAILKAAATEGVDLTWAIKENRLVWEGDLKKDAGQMAAMRNIIDVVRPRGPGIVINNQQNSVYSGMPKEVLDAEWADARRTAA